MGTDLAIIIKCTADKRVLQCVRSIDIQARIVVCCPDEHWLRTSLEDLGAYLVTSPVGNIGCSCNPGVQATDEPYLVFMDCDSVFVPGCLSQLRVHLADHPVVRARVCFQRAGLSSSLVAKLRSYKRNAQRKAYMPGLCIRRELLKDVGGFNEDIGWAIDADLDRRLRMHFIKPIVLENAVVNHPPITIHHDLKMAIKTGMASIRGESARGEINEFSWIRFLS